MTDWLGLLFIIVGVSGILVGAFGGHEYFERQAIDRGYALHCPDTGNFAWKGECDAGRD